MKTTTTKTSTTVLKTTKKPESLVRHGINKKPVKPQQNGVSVVEEITVVTSTVEKEPQLVKDNSPIDNNIIITESLQCLVSNEAD